MASHWKKRNNNIDASLAMCAVGAAFALVNVAITGGAGSSKVAQIRQTSKVAAKWGKSSFGNSVASAAGSKSGVRKVGMQKEEKQVQLSLQNGKTMKLPSASNALKSTGKFSSLQQKMAAKSKGLKKRKH